MPVTVHLDLMLVRRKVKSKELAEAMGAIPIDMRKGDPAQQILDATGGLGTDRGVEAVGYQCCDRHGKERSNYTMNCLVKSTKATGGIGVVGVFIPEDPNAPDDLQKEGKMAFDFDRKGKFGLESACDESHPPNGTPCWEVLSHPITIA